MDECFPKDNPLSKVFNRNTVKLSYSCTSNFKNYISKNNKKVFKKQNAEDIVCECRNAVCPVEGRCSESEIVYRAAVTRLDTGHVEYYTGCTKQKFRLRFNAHAQSLRNYKYWDESSLSVYVWKLKNENINYQISWKIIGKAKMYNPATKLCNLCNLEKYFILYHSDGASLNKRKEMFNFCKHKPLFSLSNQK